MKISPWSQSIQREIRWCKVWVARGVRRRGVASRSPRLRILLGNEVPITGDASGEGRAIHDDCPTTVAASPLAAARGEVHGIRAVAMNDSSEDDGENGSDSSTETVVTARRIVSHVLMSMSTWRAMFQLDPSMGIQCHCVRLTCPLHKCPGGCFWKFFVCWMKLIWLCFSAEGLW